MGCTLSWGCCTASRRDCTSSGGNAALYHCERKNQCHQPLATLFSKKAHHPRNEPGIFYSPWEDHIALYLLPLSSQISRRKQLSLPPFPQLGCKDPAPSYRYILQFCLLTSIRRMEYHLKKQIHIKAKKVFRKTLRGPWLLRKRCLKFESLQVLLSSSSR
jgi:hypothetical protein